MKQHSLLLPVLSILTLTLTGCSASFSPAADVHGGAGVSLSGSVHGGQQPISGAHVYLFAASTAGYGAASQSLLTSGDGADTLGTYALTDSGGNFNLAGDYTCTSGSQVYLLAASGNPGLTAGTENAASRLAVTLGTCPSNGTFAGAIPSISVDEVTTVAAAWALAPFALDATHIGTSSTNVAGLVNAFDTSKQMVDFTSGTPYATTPAVAGYSTASGLSGNGTVPGTKILTMANVLASCVNSDGVDGSCPTLFSYTPSSLNVTPTDVFTAAVNIAQNPGTNVSSIYNIVDRNAPFTPSLASAPDDWTMSIAYTAPNTSTPTRAAVDGSGNLWFPNYGNSTLTELNPQGVVLSGTAGFTSSTMGSPWGVAIKPTTGEPYVANATSNYISIFNSSGTGIGQFGTLLGTPITFYSMTFDSAGDAYMGSNSGVYYITPLASITDVIGTGTMYGAAVNSSKVVYGVSHAGNSLMDTSTFYTGAGLNGPTGMAVDASNNFWVANGGDNSISKFNSSGSPLSTGTGYTSAGLHNPWNIAVDGVGNVFVANSNGTLSALTSNGTAASPTTGYTTASTAGFYSAVIDSSGNVWAPNSDGIVYKFVGLAAPVATPLNTNTLGVRP